MATSKQAVLDQEDKCRNILEQGMKSMRREPGKIIMFDEGRFYEDMMAAFDELNDLNMKWQQEQEETNGD